MIRYTISWFLTVMLIWALFDLNLGNRTLEVLVLIVAAFALGANIAAAYSIKKFEEVDKQ